jgi:hypothetical protein
VWRAGAAPLFGARVVKIFVCLAAVLWLAPGLRAQGVREKRIVPVAQQERASFERQLKVAVVVGISRYPAGSGLEPLHYGGKDAADIAAELKTQGYAVRLLTDSDASRGLIRRTLTGLRDVIDPDQGTLLFYYSGHGFQEAGENYLATFGATVDDLKSEGLALREVEQLLSATRARRLLMFVDACRSNPVADARAATGRSFRDLQSAEGTRVLFSTKPGSYSYEDDGFQNGVFTYYLLRGLRGDAAGTDGLITFRDLSDYVGGAMREYSVTHGRAEIPREAGESSGDFIVGRGAIPTAPAPVPAANTASPSTASNGAGTIPGRTTLPADAGGKKWKDRAEYDLYINASKSVTANNGAQALADLEAWKTRYPASDYRDDGAVLYAQAYLAAKQPAKAVDAAADIINRGADSVFADPKTGPANAIRLLFATVAAFVQVTNPTDEEVAVAGKAAHALLAYNRKPEGVVDADWNRALNQQLQPPARAALTYIAMLPGNQAYDKKDWPGCEAAYTKALGSDPQNAFISYRLGACMRGQAAGKPEKASQAAYEFERAAVLDATLGGSASAETIKQYADRLYTTIHGSGEGLAALKILVKASPLPPDGFRIKTAVEIAAEEQAVLETWNPQLALWMRIKGALTAPDGDQYFGAQLKDSQMPLLKGTLVDARPACRPRELIVAVPMPGGTPMPEITLRLNVPINGQPALNQEFQWAGVPSAFTKNPFMLTMDLNQDMLRGLKVTPCVPYAGR